MLARWAAAAHRPLAELVAHSVRRSSWAHSASGGSGTRACGYRAWSMILRDAAVLQGIVAWQWCRRFCCWIHPPQHCPGQLQVKLLWALMGAGAGDASPHHRQQVRSAIAACPARVPPGDPARTAAPARLRHCRISASSTCLLTPTAFKRQQDMDMMQTPGAAPRPRRRPCRTCTCRALRHALTCGVQRDA